MLPWWKIAWSFFESTRKAAVSANALSLRRNSRSSSAMRRFSCLVVGLPSPSSPRPAMASRLQASSAVGNTPCSRHQTARAVAFSPAVAITASSRAAAVQRRGWSPAARARHSARRRPSVAALIPTLFATSSRGQLSGGRRRATTRSLNSRPYRAISVFHRPQGFPSYPGGNFSDTGGCALATSRNRSAVRGALSR